VLNVQRRAAALNRKLIAAPPTTIRHLGKKPIRAGGQPRLVRRRCAAPKERSPRRSALPTVQLSAGADGFYPGVEVVVGVPAMSLRLSAAARRWT